MGRVTVKDIAKACGVSFATVSNVMNGRTRKVSEKTVEAVMDAVRRLNYVPNASARSLVSNKSRLIAIFIPQSENPDHHLLENPFYSEFVAGVEDTARRLGYSIILRAAGWDIKDFSNIALSWNIDGAIVLGILGEEFYAVMRDLRIPIVLVDSYVAEKDFFHLNIDDEAGAYLAVRYLLDRGHRDIAYVSGKIYKNGVAEQRYAGYRRALLERGVTSEFVVEGDVNFEHGVETALTVIENKRLTAVFAMADILAAGLLSGFHKHGKNVNRDYSVIGFDDAYFARMTAPPLTTVNQFIAKRGRKAADLLIRILNEPMYTPQHQYFSDLAISERGSVRTI